jgi:small-conductance mechanosensitive channel
MPRRIWRQANLRLIPSAILSVAGAVIASLYGHVRTGTLDHRAIALVGVIMFVVFAVAFLHVLTSTIRALFYAHGMRAGRAGAFQFFLRILGYLIILFTTLQLLNISVAKLLLTSAVLGVILGVAAQQALANFFASIVLIISRPFSIGKRVLIQSGALGGDLTGTISDIGLTHTRLQKDDGNIVYLPNVILLSGAAIMNLETISQNQTTPRA